MFFSIWVSFSSGNGKNFSSELFSYWTRSNSSMFFLLFCRLNYLCSKTFRFWIWLKIFCYRLIDVSILLIFWKTTSQTSNPGLLFSYIAVKSFYSFDDSCKVVGSAFKYCSLKLSGRPKIDRFAKSPRLLSVGRSGTFLCWVKTYAGYLTVLFFK